MSKKVKAPKKVARKAPRTARRKGPIPAKSFTIAGKHVPSLGRVARGTGISRDGVSLIFSGQRRPSLDTAALIAGYIGVSLEQLKGYLDGLAKVEVDRGKHTRS